MNKIVNKLYQNNTVIYKAILFLITTVAIVYLFPKGTQFQYDFNNGQLWKYDNLYAPFDFAIQKTAEEINNIFFEVIIAPSYSDEALAILKSKKNRIILIQKAELPKRKTYRTVLNGVLEQDADSVTDSAENFQLATTEKPNEQESRDLEFASKICKHTKSNAIVFAKNKQLLSSGVGQTSRVDALKQAVTKAKTFNFELKDAVMASDAFFPFPDCVELADEQGIRAVIQPGGSIKDQLSIDYCNDHSMAMVFTGNRHFKH